MRPLLISLPLNILFVNKHLSTFLLAACVSFFVPAAVARTDAPAAPDFDRETAIRAGVSAHIVDLAMNAVTCGLASGDLRAPPTLTIIDYSLPSASPRLWVFDLRSGQLLFKELVAHGRNSGVAKATRFSDEMGSHQSSLGLFRTADTYVGQNGYSLRLDGLEPGFNSRSRARAIVMHGAKYVNSSMVRASGRVGRSWGCPALRLAIARKLIDAVRDGGVVFSYYPDPAWLTNSKYLRCAQVESAQPPDAPG